MDFTEVLENFLLISGESEKEINLYVPIIRRSINKIYSKLKNKDNIKLEDKPRLNHAVAVFAFYEYMLYKKAKNSSDSFKAGDISVKLNIDSSLKAAYDIWLNEKEEILDLLRDDDFSFKGIPTYKYVY